MSALGHKRTHALQQTLCAVARLLDYPVGTSQKQRRHGEPDRLRSLHVDHQIELGRLLDRQIRRLSALEDLVDKYGGTARPLFLRLRQFPPLQQRRAGAHRARRAKISAMAEVSKIKRNFEQELKFRVQQSEKYKRVWAAS
jgi:hypothetical protein